MAQTPAQPSITIERNAGAIVARVQVKLLEEKDLKQLSQMIDTASSEQPATLVVIDLAKVQMLPSLGLGTLVQISNKCRARQQRLRLAAVTPPVRQVLSITRLDRVLDLADSVEAAIE